MDVTTVVAAQREFHDAGGTRDLDVRVAALTQLRQVLVDRAADIHRAVRADLDRVATAPPVDRPDPDLEAIDCTLGQLTGRPRTKPSTLFFTADSALCPEPYGVTLIVSAWTCSLTRLINPVVGAVAAGNTAILNPVGESPDCVRLAAEIVAEAFWPEHAVVLAGTGTVTAQLLAQRLDYVFFTGNPPVGRIVRDAAEAELATPRRLAKYHLL